MSNDPDDRQLYLGVKQARAVPFVDDTGCSGYLVELEDNEGIRFYPKKEFESCYTPITSCDEVTHDDLLRMVSAIYYRRLDTKTILCTVATKTGFIFYGFSSCATPGDVDDYTIGKENALNNAIAQLRSMMSFSMQWGRDRIQFPYVPPSIIDLTDIAPM